ncbi:MAG: SAM-dependent methyltransferase [Ruminococcaceae bacterium]|nr:SAM-dependent methyltransferase [Oscillospiraceae bacterium]
MKQLELTPRLHAVAELVPDGAFLADIGTDHAYLPVWLLLEGKIAHAIAADLREGPLDRAKLTAKEYNCTKNITFRLCDGLFGIAPEEADTIVIAGMGGETIAAILDQAAWTKNESYTLILQPMSAQNDLRRWLWQQGYGIRNEQVVREGDKLYNILFVRYGCARELSIGEEWAGCQSPDMKQELRGEYLARLLEKTDRAIAGISRGKGEKDNARLEELRLVRQTLAEMKKEWDAWQQP